MRYFLRMSFLEVWVRVLRECLLSSERYFGTGRQFLNRHMLASHNISEAVDRATVLGRAGGFRYVITCMIFQFG